MRPFPPVCSLIIFVVFLLLDRMAGLMVPERKDWQWVFLLFS